MHAPDLAARFDRASRTAIAGCGASDVLYTNRYSNAVDAIVVTLPEAQRAGAIELARQHGDYATCEERERMDEIIAESGDCPLTGIDPDCCPCGRHG